MPLDDDVTTVDRPDADRPGQGSPVWLRRRLLALAVTAAVVAAAVLALELVSGDAANQRPDVSLTFDSWPSTGPEPSLLTFPAVGQGPTPSSSPSRPRSSSATGSPTRAAPSTGMTPPSPAQTGPPVQPRYGVIVGLSRMCLQLRDQVPLNGNWIDTASCTGGPAQVWQTGPDLSLRVMETCVRERGGSSVPGTSLEAWTCDNSPGQQWQFINGVVINMASGLCLSSSSADTATSAVVVTAVCRPVPAQRWTGPVPLNNG